MKRHQVSSAISWLMWLLVSVLAFAAVGWIGRELTGVHPAGRLDATPFVFLVVFSASGAAISAIRLSFTIQHGDKVLKDSRESRRERDTKENAELLRARQQTGLSALSAKLHR